jgi:hypothetical protein
VRWPASAGFFIGYEPFQNYPKENIVFTISYVLSDGQCEKLQKPPGHKMGTKGHKILGPNAGLFHVADWRNLDRRAGYGRAEHDETGIGAYRTPPPNSR